MTNGDHLPGSISSSTDVRLCCGFRASGADMLTASCPAKLNVFLEVLENALMDITNWKPSWSARPCAISSPCDERLVQGSRCDSAMQLPRRMRKGIPLDESNLILRAATIVSQRDESSSRC